MKLHHINGYIQDTWLVEEPHGLMLLDGASRADVIPICKFITDELGYSLSHLKTIIVTHMHPDHAGGAHVLRKLSNAKIISANVEGQWYKGISGILMQWIDIALALWVAGRMKKPRRFIWYSPWLSPDIKLPDGASVPGFDDWQVLFTQGHTDRDLSIRHLPSNSVYVADLMVTVKGRYIPPYPVFYPNRYKASIVKIRDLKPEHIMLAHGGKVQLNVEDFDYLLQKAPSIPATHWRSLKGKLGKMLGFGPKAA